MKPEATLSIRLFRPFVSLSLARRPDRSVEWEVSGIAALLADPEARIPHTVANSLLSVAEAHIGTPDVGLLAAEHLKPGDFDLFELALQTNPTLGSALEGLPQLLPILHNGARLVLSERGTQMEARMRLDEGLELHPVGHDFVLAGSLLSMQRIAGRPDLGPDEVLFPYPPREDLSVYRRIFRSKLTFDAPFAGMRFDRGLLAQRSLHANPAVRMVLERAALELLATQRGADHLSGQVVATIADQLKAGEECSAATVAKKLGLSQRTLQRRLGEDDTSFRALLDEHRERLARAYLSRSELTFAEIAFLLGFTSRQAFHKAFKRWTEMTPAEHREAQGGAGVRADDEVPGG